MLGSLRAPLPGVGLAACTLPGACHMSRGLLVAPASARSLAGASAPYTGGGGRCVPSAFGQSGASRSSCRGWLIVTGSQAGAGSGPPSRPPRRDEWDGTLLWVHVWMVLITVWPILLFLPVSNPLLSACIIVYILWLIFGFM